MEKTVSILIEELKANISNTINDSGLHISVVDLVLTHIAGNVHEAALNQYHIDLNALNEKSPEAAGIEQSVSEDDQQNE